MDKITEADCLSVATTAEETRLSQIFDIDLLKHLALRWCKQNEHRLYGYLGKGSWDCKEVEDESNNR